jgi:23S rRNA (guanosine2251-2'-O)-methyltransferase
VEDATTEILYGFHPLREALRHRPHDIERVLIASSRRGGRRREIEELCRRHQIEVQSADDKVLDRRTGGVHNGFLAELRRAASGQQDVERDVELVVLLEDIQDPRNLGAILRICEGSGVGRVLIRDRGSAPLSPAVVKTSAGASEWLNIERIVNSANTLESLKKEGFWVYGTDAGGKPPWQIDLSGKIVLCFGGEEKGLRARTRRICDELVGLPMRGRVDSLNVSAATAAVLFEAVRQRMTGERLPPT